MGLLRDIAKKVLRRPHVPRPPDGAPSPAPGPANHPTPATDTETSSTGSATATDKPWYLDGSNDGWDTTDVKKE